MPNEWGRDESYNWPSNHPIYTYIAVAIALLLTCFVGWIAYTNWTPLQQYWLSTYVYTSILPELKIADGRYRLLAIQGQDKQFCLPADNEVQSSTVSTPGGNHLPFELSEEAQQQGKTLLLLPLRSYNNDRLRDDLRDKVYEGMTLSELARSPVLGGVVFLIAGFMLALPADRQRARIRKYGRRMKGPEEVTAAEFNQRNQSDGIGFITLEKPTLSDRILRREWQHIRIPRALEDNHLLLMGDSGSGKSSLIRQLLAEIDQRGESAIVYDPALEYVGQFYSTQRGDVILNPLDERMPYWTASSEVLRPAEALTVAAALFPDAPRENPFFVEGPRKIFAHLLNLKLSNEELIHCLSHEEELDRKLKGTELAPLIYPNAGQQRGGMLASLSLVADSLKLLPHRNETSRTWSAVEWSRTRRSWIFLTGIPSARKQLRPLVSMWLDVLILRLMNEGHPGSHPAWFVLDELSSLNHLPQLHTAITENRKSGNPLVLAFQGRSQLEATYGHVAEAMFSQPATKIFLRTSEPNAAQWISSFIGNMEIERLRESRSTAQMPQQRETRTYNLEQEIRPLVMKEEITGLDKGHGYLKCGNLVVRLSFPYVEYPEKHREFIERHPPAVPINVLPETVDSKPHEQERPTPSDDKKQQPAQQQFLK